jgi:hypothetical protein
MLGAELSSTQLLRRRSLRVLKSLNTVLFRGWIDGPSARFAVHSQWAFANQTLPFSCCPLSSAKMMRAAVHGEFQNSRAFLPESRSW